MASDIRNSSKQVMQSGPFETLDVMDEELLETVVKKYQVTQIYLLGARITIHAEQNIELGTWKKLICESSFSCFRHCFRDGLVKDILVHLQSLSLDLTLQSTILAQTQLWIQEQFVNY